MRQINVVPYIKEPISKYWLLQIGIFSGKPQKDFRYSIHTFLTWHLTFTSKQVKTNNSQRYQDSCLYIVKIQKNECICVLHVYLYTYFIHIWVIGSLGKVVPPTPQWNGLKYTLLFGICSLWKNCNKKSFLALAKD